MQRNHQPVERDQHGIAGDGERRHNGDEKNLAPGKFQPGEGIAAKCRDGDAEDRCGERGDNAVQKSGPELRPDLDATDTLDIDAEQPREVVEGEILREEVDGTGREVGRRRDGAGKRPVDRAERPDEQRGDANPDS